MGKVRVNVIGDESLEQKQKEKAQKRREVKDMEKSKELSSEYKTPKEEEVKEPKDEAKKVVKKKAHSKKTRSPRYAASRKLTDKNKTYSIKDALSLLKKMQYAKFDETVELHINTNDKGISGQITLPHGTGKKTKVAILAPTVDAAGAEKLLKDIESGKINFDVLVATPDAMPKLAKVARILGPKGLMPNPKAGTVTPKPEEVAKKYEAGQLNFKTEAKANIIHVAVGKMSFGEEKLNQNIDAFIGALDRAKVKNVYLKSTMSPSLRLYL